MNQGVSHIKCKPIKYAMDINMHMTYLATFVNYCSGTDKVAEHRANITLLAGDRYHALDLWTLLNVNIINNDRLTMKFFSYLLYT